MAITNRLATALVNVETWRARHRVLVAVALVVLPVLAALAVALLTRSTVYACIPDTTGSGCGPG